MTTPIAHYPEEETTGHDLDPNADGDLVLEGRVEKTQAALIAANSQDGQNWSASVEWVDSDGNVFRSQSATDIGLSAVDNDDARLVRKGPRVRVTFTSEAAAGTQNRINAFVDAHR